MNRENPTIHHEKSSFESKLDPFFEVVQWWEHDNEDNEECKKLAKVLLSNIDKITLWTKNYIQKTARVCQLGIRFDHFEALAKKFFPEVKISELPQNEILYSNFNGIINDIFGIK